MSERLMALDEYLDEPLESDQAHLLLGTRYAGSFSYHFPSLNSLVLEARTAIIVAATFPAKDSSGEHVLRLGADKQLENTTLLDTGEPMYTPVL
ncbi:hypothetical protein Tco_0952066 [Tanacetum coccineum]|uniref:Uncharacterized protein n=1 Tax=Tanacetum coccineum TaxID=301880 RepID=A0ABQ5DYR9_9ASTR